ncbi:MAG: hypothetical protein H0Z40_08945 [Desulfotomaculum sp.]|nr:hypothetical protein [Desulfotomaculum sp.]
MPDFNKVWNRILSNEGETFRTKTGKEFTYIVVKDCLIPSRTDQKITKADIKKAYKLIPFNGPGVINNTVRGPSYIWAILHDNRTIGK